MWDQDLWNVTGTGTTYLNFGIMTTLLKYFRVKMKLLTCSLGLYERCLWALFTFLEFTEAEVVIYVIDFNSDNWDITANMFTLRSYCMCSQARVQNERYFLKEWRMDKQVMCAECPGHMGVCFFLLFSCKFKRKYSKSMHVHNRVIVHEKLILKNLYTKNTYYQMKPTVMWSKFSTGICK